MNKFVDSPILVFVFSLVAQWLFAQIGALFRTRLRPVGQDERDDLDVVLTATLTLLGLIIGFSFSMAINRYDQRKTYEEGEANAIGTEYLRIGLLPSADRANLRSLLRDYLAQRISFYETREENALRQIDAATAKLQDKLWASMEGAAVAQPTPVFTLVVSGMNDVLNSEGYTQAAWWNRIPPGAWFLMIVVAISANLLIGYASHSTSTRILRLLVLPFVLCIAFYAIADIDSPRRGTIRVYPQNLVRLAESLDRH
jgi:hypothetical protein